MANYPTASLSITFSTEILDEDGNTTEGYLSAELNSEDNNGKSSFLFGDTANYRVYKASNVTLQTPIVSDGSEGPVSSGLTEEIVEVVTFSGSETASTSKYIQSLTSAVRLGGRDLGSISKVGPTSVRCSRVSTGPLDPLVGVYKLTYQTSYSLRRLFSVSQPAGFGVDGFDSYPVVIYLIGVVA